MKKNQSSSLVLLSGGQDSTTCLFWALKKFSTVRALSFSYGQRHSKEVEIAKKIASKANVPIDILDASIIGKISENSLTDPSLDIEDKIKKDSYPNTFVPGRNMFFLTIAAVFARSHGIKDIITGVSQSDYSGYPDCRDTFIKSINVTLNLAMDDQFILHTPLMWIDKAEEWKMADDLGIFDLVKNETLTCYNGIVADGCGHCPACRLRKKGLEKYLAWKEKKKD